MRVLWGMGVNGYVLCTFGVSLSDFSFFCPFLFLFPFPFLFLFLFLAILPKKLHDYYLLIDDDACISRI